VKKRGDTYNVSLNTGNIKIRLNDDKGSTIYLDPGDFFQYSKKEKSLTRKKVKAELYSDWKDEKMILDNAPLSELATLIHDTYGYNTIINNKKLEQEKISGTIMLKDEQTFLDALRFALNIDIIKKDNDLIFQTKTKTE
jgi:ferric-dicitrate binding protein FerR (iron transport regulator)